MGGRVFPRTRGRKGVSVANLMYARARMRLAVADLSLSNRLLRAPSTSRWPLVATGTIDHSGPSVRPRVAAGLTSAKLAGGALALQRCSSGRRHHELESRPRASFSCRIPFHSIALPFSIRSEHRFGFCVLLILVRLVCVLAVTRSPPAVRAFFSRPALGPPFSAEHAPSA
jgi:hypothetical protein